MSQSVGHVNGSSIFLILLIVHAWIFVHDFCAVLPEGPNRHFLIEILSFRCVTRCREFLVTYFLNASCIITDEIGSNMVYNRPHCRAGFTSECE